MKKVLIFLLFIVLMVAMPVVSHYANARHHRNPSSLVNGQQYIVVDNQLVAINSPTTQVVDANGNTVNYTNNNYVPNRPAITSSPYTVADIETTYSNAIFNETMLMPRENAFNAQLDEATRAQATYREALVTRVRANPRPGSAVDLIEWEGTNPGTVKYSEITREKLRVHSERLSNVNMAIFKMQMYQVNIPAGKITEAQQQRIAKQFDYLFNLRAYLNSGNSDMYMYPTPATDAPMLVANNPVVDQPTLPATVEVKADPQVVATQAAATVEARVPLNANDFLPTTERTPIAEPPVDIQPAVIPVQTTIDPTKVIIGDQSPVDI